MSSILEQLAGRLLPLQDVFMGFGVEIFLSSLILLHYRRFGSALSSQQSFGPVIAFVALTTFLVITVVKSSFALSLGLVGALSIVRFRTPVKDPDELAYIFLAIASGIGTAAGQRLLTLSLVIMILLIMVLMRRTLRITSENVFVSMDLVNVTDVEAAFAAVKEVVGSNAARAAFMRHEMHDDIFHLTAEAELAEPEAMSRITNQLRERFPGTNVSFYDESAVPSP